MHPNFAREACGTWIDPIEKIIAIYHRNFNSARKIQSGKLQVSVASLISGTTHLLAPNKLCFMVNKESSNIQP
jgi:hypothetical protein